MEPRSPALAGGFFTNWATTEAQRKVLVMDFHYSLYPFCLHIFGKCNINKKTENKEHSRQIIFSYPKSMS